MYSGEQAPSFLSCWSLILGAEHGVYICLRLSTMSVHTQLGIGFVHLYVISQAYRGVSFDNHILRTLKLRSRCQSLRRVAFTGVETLTPFPGSARPHLSVFMRTPRPHLPLSLRDHLPLWCKGVVVTQSSSFPRAR